MSFATLLLRYIIFLFHSPLPHHGFTSTMLQSSQMKLRWLKGAQLNGEDVSEQSSLMLNYMELHAGTTLLQFV